MSDLFYISRFNYVTDIGSLSVEFLENFRKYKRLPKKYWWRIHPNQTEDSATLWYSTQEDDTVLIAMKNAFPTVDSFLMEMVKISPSGYNRIKNPSIEITTLHKMLWEI